MLSSCGGWCGICLESEPGRDTAVEEPMLNLGTAGVPGAASLEGANMPASVIDLADDLFDLLPVAIHVLDADGRVVRFNRSAAALWGGPPPAADACGLGPRASPVREREIAIDRPTGTHIVALITVHPVHAPHARLAGALACAH